MVNPCQLQSYSDRLDKEEDNVCVTSRFLYILVPRKYSTYTVVTMLGLPILIEKDYMS